ncbi:MAG TPA: fumarate hydratase [Firmicutes bacterium]|jgi:fumarate hydratase subunit alpha|nr:fumarate hydratase [Bacillota bacterium]HBT17196.1 fumarate hydratase [Bacillota bacterium]
MREINVAQVTETVAQLCIDACLYLGDDVVELLRQARKKEVSDFGCYIFERLLENLNIAAEQEIPICQDTGMTVVFLKIGQELHFTGGNLTDAINKGVRLGYQRGYLRKSVLTPLERVNTNDNTPAVIHTAIVPGDRLKIIVAPKGGGSENMSRLKMLKPADGIEGIKKFVLETIVEAGASPCPPIILGIGIGGTMEKAALMSKEALLRRAGTSSSDPIVAKLEKEMLELVNKTGIGPQGLGGNVTALAVHIETYPTHIAALPVAVNIQCHAARHQEAIL